MARNSNNLEGSLFSGQYTKMERSNSFREGLESRAAGTSRNTQQTAEIPPLTQYLDLDLPMREQQQKSRSAELRRMLGTGLDDHGFGSVQSKAAPTINPEEMKRFKASLSESASKAGESAKFFQDQVAKVDRYKNAVAKKRQRSSADISGEKTGGSSFSKIGGSQASCPVNQVLPGEHVGQRQDDRPKNLIPNKRARSSLGESRSEGRALGSMRQAPSNTEKEKNTIEKEKSSTGKISGNGPTPSEEKPRALTPGGEGWEKKLKRKRSVGSMVNRANDGAHADSKQSAPPRPNINTENRRSNDNGLASRSGLPSGTIGVNKTDVSSQQSIGNGTRSSVKADNDNNLNERREQRSSALEKDRSIPKGNKLVSRDESQGSSLNPMAKSKASRAPRTNSFVVMNSSPSFPRFPGSSSDGWDSPSTAHKVQSAPPPGQSASNAPATSNRKRPLPSGPPSPSPPVTQWVGTRPHKIQRTRRANVVSPVSNFDEIQAPNDESVPSPSASILNNIVSSTVLQQKSKGDVVSSPPAGLSESDESKGKGVENGEMVDKKASTLINKKANRVLLKEELGDGVRRQGRSGRSGGSGHGRSLPPLPKEKMDGNDSATKPPKSGRPTSDKNDSRIGRPPLKKTADRKSQGRPGQNPHVLPSDMMGGLDDDKEELLSAINAARIACFDACTGPFWKKMEPVFVSTSDDMSFLKNQIAFAEALERSASEVIVDKYNNEEKDPSQLLPSSHKSGTVGPTLIGSTGRTKTDDWFEQAVPLSQMLLSAFISIDGSELLLDSNNYTANGNSDHYPYEIVDKGQCNGFLDGSLLTSHCQNGPYSQSILQNHEMVLNSAHAPLYECQYEDMSLDDRILLELHSIGIYPDSGPELDEGEGTIDMSASELQKELTQKVKERKNIMQTLENAFPDTKRIDERHIEQLAMDKLVERASKKLSAGRGGSSHKGGANKLSKQLAQAFGKRTLDRCHKFEGCGQSCFSSDPSLRDILLAPLQHPNSKQADGVNERQNLERGPSDLLEQSQVKADHQISSRGKKREVLLEEVSRGTASVFGPKWKKSDQTKDGSGKNSSPNTNAKGGRGERKNKTKPKQKMGHLSSSSQNDFEKVLTADGGHLDVVGGSSNKPGQRKTELPGPSSDMNDSLFAGLPIPFDDLDSVPGDANDLSSWLNVEDDESLQDIDLVGLEVPMDDITDFLF